MERSAERVQAGVRAMLALEMLINRAKDDPQMLAILVEAWSREGYGVEYLPKWAHDARARRNRQKLRWQADAIRAMIQLMPLDQLAWQRIAYARHGVHVIAASDPASVCPCGHTLGCTCAECFMERCWPSVANDVC